MATARTDLTFAAWSDLGAAPAFVQAIEGNVYFVVESTAPTTRRTDCHFLSANGPFSTADIGLTGNVYARAASPAGAAAAVIVSR